MNVKRFLNRVAAAVRPEGGQGMVEYALIIALVAVALVGALVALNGGISNIFNSITNAL